MPTEAEGPACSAWCGNCACALINLSVRGQDCLALPGEHRIIPARNRRSRGPLKDIVAIYPGSFDPVTNGHLDLIHRGSKLFDKLIVAIARNLDKGEALFEMEERKQMLEAMTSELDNVSVDIFEGLLVTYCITQNANAVLRGIRAVSDYEFELQMALMKSQDGAAGRNRIHDAGGEVFVPEFAHRA